MKTSDLIKLGLTPEQAARLSRNGQYWKIRFGQVEQAQHDRGVQAFQKIDAQYRQAQKDIEAKIDAWYRRFADNEGITLQEARKMLDAKQLAEFKWDVNDYIRYGQENAISGQWAKELENASARFHISRLEALKVQCQQDVEVLFGAQADIFDQAMRDIYKSGYYHNTFELQKGIGVGWDFSALDPKHIDRVINTPWTVDGRNFSTRIWDSKEKLIGEIDQTLTQNIILGKDPQKAIDAIAARLNVSKSQAGRLVMTEEAYFSSMAQNDCFKDLDVDKYEIVATLDSITSDICRSMDGKVFKMSEWEIGVTAPPFHPWCRTTTVPAFDDDFGLVGERAAKDEKGKTYYVPANMTYKQWEKAFVQGNKTGLQQVQPVQQVQSGGIMEPDPSVDRSKAQKAVDPDVQKILDRYPVIQVEHTYEQDIKAVNPHYAESKKKRNKQYTNNCQRCVNAYEARRRGYDVEAGARIISNDPLAVMMNDKGWANVYENGRDQLVQCFSNSADGVRKKVIDQMKAWGDGARAIVRVQWKGGTGGHVFISEVHGDEILFMDPQTGSMDCLNYFDLAKVNKTHLLRIDDKEFTTLIQDCCFYKLGGQK